MSGRLDSTFSRLRQSKEKALIAYLMAGDPGLPETEQLVVALEQAGADIIELGVPFSDPIADGPVIQQAAERALKAAHRFAVSLRQSPRSGSAQRFRLSSCCITTPSMPWAVENFAKRQMPPEWMD